MRALRRVPCPWLLTKIVSTPDACTKVGTRKGAPIQKPSLKAQVIAERVLADTSLHTSEKARSSNADPPPFA